MTSALRLRALQHARRVLHHDAIQCRRARFSADEWSERVFEEATLRRYRAAYVNAERFAFEVETIARLVWGL